MMAPGQYSFGAPSVKPASNPFAVNPFAQQSTTKSTTPFGAPSSSSSFSAPFSAAVTGISSSSQRPVANPFGTPSASASSAGFGAPLLQPPSNGVKLGAPSPFGTNAAAGSSNAFGAPAQPAQGFSGATAPNAGPFGSSSSSSPAFGPPSAAVKNPFGAPSTTAMNSLDVSSKPGVSRAPSPSDPYARNLKQPPPQASNGQNIKAQSGAAGKPSCVDRTRTGGQTPPLKNGKRGQSAAPGSGGNSNKPAFGQANNTSKELDRPDVWRPGPKKPLTNHTAQPAEETRKLSAFAGEFADKLNEKLRNDGLNAPQWPTEPGNPMKRAAMDKLKEVYKKYRAKVYASLRRAELIDDPDKRRKLEDALAFKGICEDMCPEYEQVTRICEYDVKPEEKTPAPDGLSMWPDPSRMVKKFGRSAAGQDAPLPMDIRSVDALRRTTDYLLGELLQRDEDLPTLHNFLWDRTRAVRKDFTFHSTKTPEEMRVLVYCFETITRFHAIALHLLSRPGFAAEDFDQKQEIEQLGRSLLSLIEAYDDCRKKGIECENESEFRAYHLLLNSHDPFIVQRSLEWGREVWYESDDVQLALSLVHAMQSVDEARGPLRPFLGSTLSDGVFTNFFAMVGSPAVSYTMACIAEIHFTYVRQCILKVLVKAYARRRDWPKDITPAVLNRMLRFDTDEEAVRFAEQHDFEFISENTDQPYLALKSKRRHVPSPRVLQSYSGKIVERKRGDRSLPYVIHNTVYEEIAPETANQEEAALEDDADSLFVSQPTGSVAWPRPQLQDESRRQSLSSPVVSPGATKNATDTTSGNPFLGSQEPRSPFLPAASISPSPSTSGHVGAGMSSKEPTLFTSQTAQQSVQATPASSDIQLNKTITLVKPGISSSASLCPVSSSSSSPFATVQAETSPLSPFTTPKGGVPPSKAFQPLNSGTSELPPANDPAICGSASSADQTSKPPSVQFSATSSPANQSSAPSIPPAGQMLPKSVLISQNQSAPTNMTSTTVKPAQRYTGGGGTLLGQSTSAQAPAVSSQKLEQPLSLPGSASGTGTAASMSISKSLAKVPPTPSSSATQQVQPKPSRKELMDGLNKWYVLGDDGLLEQFVETTVIDLLQDTFDQWQRDAAERKRKEEDEQSWAAARAFRTHSLGMRYFYRWRELARARAQRRLLLEGRAKMRAYREQERAAELARREAARKAEEKAQRRATMGDDVARLLGLDRQRWQRRTKEENGGVEDQLLASGVFSGVRDGREAVRRVVREVDLKDATRRRASSVLSTATITTARTPASQQQQTPPRKEGWKTRSLREQYVQDAGGWRSRSNSFGSSSLYAPTSSFRTSLPAPAKATNFSRKRSLGADATGREAASAHNRKSIKSRHWEMRARGLVLMPNGQWLPESIALQIQEGKRFKGIGDCGIGSGNRTEGEDGQQHESDGGVYGNKEVGHEVFDEDYRDREVESADAANALDADQIARQERLDRLAARFGFSIRRRNGYTGSDNSASTGVGGNDSVIATPATKRKRPVDDEVYDDDGEGPLLRRSPVRLRDESFAVADEEGENEEGGKAVEDTIQMVEDLQRMVRELHEDMDNLDEDRPWFREQVELMEKNQSMWD
ncbi:hypothetical protein VTK73DRAFT_8177 [Phialemonium thermophilum]|uniref:SAC3/GANP/THP3 conserved domain-containing protein n=1 Tax=Phialemonium thermophilum TaxID=223376 RepID=A0ABR3XPW7_9PEZI